jgi:hypothetical protein
MSEALTEKIDRIETLLREINAKIDNFLGFDELDNDEQKELETLRKEIEAGEYINFDEAFED